MKFNMKIRFCYLYWILKTPTERILKKMAVLSKIKRYYKYTTSIIVAKVLEKLDTQYVSV